VIKKRDQAEPIDAGVATIISNGRAQPDRQDVSVYEHRGLAVLDGAPDMPDMLDEDDDRTTQALKISPELAAMLGLDPAPDGDDEDDDDDDELEDDEWDALIRSGAAARRTTSASTATYLGGLALIVIGCAWIYGPLGFIVAGALLVRTAWRARPRASARAGPTRCRVSSAGTRPVTTTTTRRL
jgi:hypothetical protein